MFSFELISGDLETALVGPSSIVLSERAAARFYGETNPVGQTLSVDNGLVLTVTGVSRNIGRTSSLRFDGLVSMEASNAFSADPNAWTSNDYLGFVMLRDGAKPRSGNTFLTDFIDRHFAEAPESPEQMYLFPLLDFRLHGDHISTLMATAPSASTFILQIFGMLLLLIVCVNFVNMSIARQMFRTREIGIRKVVGAKRSNLLIQFLGESVLI